MNKDQYRGLYSRPATMALRRVFGDFVEKVFISMEYSPPLEDVKREVKEECSDDLFEWSGSKFIVQFTNGRVVHMFNSDWASFQRLHNFEEFNFE